MEQPKKENWRITRKDPGNSILRFKCRRYPLISYMTLGKIMNQSLPWFPHWGS